MGLLGISLSFLKEVDWSGIGAILLAGLAGAAFTLILQHLYSRRTFSEQQKFRIYLLLLDAHISHFWISSAEVRGEEKAAPEAIERFNEKRLKISDEARKLKKFPEAEKILSILYSLKYASEGDRFRDLLETIDEMGKNFHPDFTKVMKRIGKENDDLLKNNPELYAERIAKIWP